MEDGLSGTFAIIWFQIAILVLFAKEFLPQDMTWVWRQFIKKKKPTPEEIEAIRQVYKERNLQIAREKRREEAEWGRPQQYRSRWGRR
jgi:hypothetical protein